MKYSYDRTDRVAASPRVHVEKEVILNLKDIGSLAIRERPLKDLIRNLENVLAKLKKHEGDVFVK